MADFDLAERIKSEEDTLSCLPFEPDYRRRRAELTDLVNQHRAMLVRRLRGEVTPEAEGTAEAVPRVGRVAIVGREPLTALLLRLVVENRGHCVRDVASGAEAIALVDSWNPDVVVADRSVVDMSGAEMVARLRSHAPRGLRIVLTGSWRRPISGVDAVFPWPYEAEVVAERIDFLIGNESDALAVVECPAEDPRVAARSHVVGEIWRQMTNVSTKTGHCDVECDEALEQVRCLLSLVDYRATGNFLADFSGG